MRVRKTFLILYLATGLSVGLLSSCNPFSKSQEQPPASSTGTSNQPVTDNQQTPAITNLELEELIKKRAALNTFVANIKVTEKQTKVENPVDYAEAKKIVDELANAYKTFKDSLSNDIKTKIGFNNIDSKIEPILEGTSQQRKILEDLAKSQYREAQTKLSQLEINSRRIYQSDIDGEDGSKQRIATKKLLEQILNVTQPLATLKIDNSSTQNPTNSNSPTNSLTTNDLKIQLEQLKKDINRNNWVWPLFNTLALLAIAVIVFLSFFLVWNKISSILVIYQTKKSTDLGKDEQQILEHLQKIKSVLDGLGNKIIWLQIVPFNKKQVDSSELKNMVDTFKNLDDQFKELYTKIIISQSIHVKSDEAESDREKDTKTVDFQNWLEAQLQSIKKEIITDVKSTSLDETTQNTLKDLSGKVSNIQAIVGSLSIGKEGGSISQYKEKVEQLEIKIKDLESTANENVEEIEKLKTEIDRPRKLVNKEAIETEDIPRHWQNIINSYNQSPDDILNIHGVHKQGEVVEDTGERRNNSSKPVVLTSNMSPDGFYIVSVGNDYLLFPKQNAIAPSQKFTASALFDGYRSGNISKFTLILPAQVTPVGGGGRWQLKYKGKLEYN